MAQSLNSKIDLKIKANSYLGIAEYGNVMIGDKAFEYYSDRNVENFIQIPWNEVEYVSASVLFNGRWINRFAIFTKNNGHLTFSTKDNKETLRAMQIYIKPEMFYKSPTFFKTLISGYKNILTRNK